VASYRMTAGHVDESALHVVVPRFPRDIALYQIRLDPTAKETIIRFAPSHAFFADAICQCLRGVLLKP
jgi:hypothetical protein